MLYLNKELNLWCKIRRLLFSLPSCANLWFNFVSFALKHFWVSSMGSSSCFLHRGHIWIENPPRRLSSSLIRNFLELLVQRQVVSDRIFPSCWHGTILPLSKEWNIEHQPFINLVQCQSLLLWTVDSLSDEISIALMAPRVPSSIIREIIGATATILITSVGFLRDTL